MRERYLAPVDALIRPVVPICGFSEREFELLVSKYVRDQVNSSLGADRLDRVRLTPRSADNGRDIVVSAFDGQEFLNLDLETRASRKILIECKVTQKTRLSFEHVAANVVQIEPHEGDVFLLVTNATLTPRSIYLIQEQCRRVGCRFLLIDALNFAECMPGLSESTDSHVYPSVNGPVVTYQVLKDPEVDNRYCIHFLFRAPVNAPTRFAVSLHSTYSWEGSLDSNGTDFLYGGNVLCRVLRVKPSGIRPSNGLTVRLQVNDDNKVCDIAMSRDADQARIPIFKSDMCGSLARIARQLDTSTLPHFVHVHGCSGSGKSRLLEEVASVAQKYGLACQFAQLSERDIVIPSDQHRALQQVTQRSTLTLWDFLAQRRLERHTGETLLLLVDDIDAASPEALRKLSALSLSPCPGLALIVAGRSDSPSRMPSYQAFAQMIGDNQSDGYLEQYVLGTMTADEVQSAFDVFLGVGSIVLPGMREHKTALRPVDLVHAVHSLMERHYAIWIDEDRLSLTAEVAVATSNLVMGSVLEYRYQYLQQLTVHDFRLSGLLEMIAVIDDPPRAFLAVTKLLGDMRSPLEPILLWMNVDYVSQTATFQHDSLKEFLVRKFYSFGTKPVCRAVATFAPELLQNICPEHQAAFALSDGSVSDAARLIAPFAKVLRRVTNISSLSLNIENYNNFATLIAILLSGTHLRARLLYRCVVARAYLNTHHVPYSLGFVDNLALTSLVEDLENYVKKDITVAAIKQLTAHGLQNSGDYDSALSLMHEVDYFLRQAGGSAEATTVEFDLYDRLQTYYGMHSSFRVARMFFLRARRCAHLSRNHALLDISLSGEFHLCRYLDCDEACRIATSQLRHSKRHAPRRSQIHAEINDIVARWAVSLGTLPTKYCKKLMSYRKECERSGYGHLVPRIDYLIAVYLYGQWSDGKAPVKRLQDRIDKGERSAFLFGHVDYVWLMASIRLLVLIDCKSEDKKIAAHAATLLDFMDKRGLTHIAEDYLCFQNSVALSNALRALFEYSDEVTAWHYARKVTFSPLFLPEQRDRDLRIRSVFKGGLLTTKCDSRALILNNQGYAVILV